MKIIDCFMYFNEDLILDVRLNELDGHVDKFVIVESCFPHSGERKTFNFDINKYQKFLISSHVNLEGDAICSELALAELLKSKGKISLEKYLSIE